MRPPFIALLLVLASCTSASSGEVSAGAAPAANSSTHLDAVARAAAEYRSWGAVGPHVRWAPYLCSAPPPPAAAVSIATGSAGHGRKLYALYASDAAAYLDVTDPTGEAVPFRGDTGRASAAAPRPAEVPAGFALVKESYAPEVVDAAAVPKRGSREEWRLAEETGFLPFAERDGKTYRTGERRDLFVMAKVALAAGAPDDTDAGWIYGTVSPQGEVTSAGRVASCMECHARAPRDRLFGLPRPSGEAPAAK